MYGLQNRKMARHRFNEQTWSKIYAELKRIPNIHVGNEKKSRNFVEGVHWILRTGAPWRDLPAEFGKWNSVFKRFGRWSDEEIWEQLHHRMIQEPDMEWLLIDSTVVRAHPSAAGAPRQKQEDGEVEPSDQINEIKTDKDIEQAEIRKNQQKQALGKSVGGFSTKIHVVVDALGNPLRLILTGGEAGDAPQAIPLLEGFDFEKVMADRAYDTNQLLLYLEECNGEAVIPSKKNRIIQRKHDKHLYKARHLVECYINKLKQYRRAFSRFDKYAVRYMGFLSLASALIWLK